MNDGAQLIVALMEKIAGLIVIALLRLHRLNGANIPHHLCCRGKIARDLKSVGSRRNSFHRSLNFLTGLEVEGIEVTHAACHIEEDDIGGRIFPLCRYFLTKGLRSQASSKHGCQTDTKKLAGGITKKFTTGEFVAKVGSWIH